MSTASDEAGSSQGLEVLDHDIAEAISFTLGAVTHNALRGWANGLWSIGTARQHVQRTVELVFAPPPDSKRG